MVRFLILLSIFCFIQSAFSFDCSLKSHEDIGQKILTSLEKNPISCKGQKVHLSFDDGPFQNSTPQILNELNTRNVKASFFVTSKNLELKPESGRIVSETLNSGHLISSHGHEHRAYDLRLDREGRESEVPLTQSQKEEEIKKSVSYLNKVTNNEFDKQSLKLFRFPYGRGAMPSENELRVMEERAMMTFQSHSFIERLKEYRRKSPALHTLSGFGFSHLGWNHDSGDSALPYSLPEEDKIIEYVKTNLLNLCKASTPRVALYHDTKMVNTVAVPLIIDIGQCLGLKFVSVQEIIKEPSLSSSGVLIQKVDLAKGVVENVLEGLSAAKDSGVVNPACTNPETLQCWSEYTKRWYNDCEGINSICLGGRWYSRQDEIIKNNCQLNDS